MFDMIAERRLNDAESGGVNGLRDAEYMKQEIANWKAELQKICDDTLGAMDKDLTPSESTGESKEFDFKAKEDYCGYTVYTVDLGTSNPTSMVAESCETIRTAPENVIVGSDGVTEDVGEDSNPIVRVFAKSGINKFGRDAEESVTLQETCNPRKSEHLSTRETAQNIPDIPARSARQLGKLRSR